MFCCIPLSTDSDGDKRGFEHDLGDALNKGTCVVLNITKILTTGAATAGKTCTKHYIFDMPPPKQYNSTDAYEPMERHYAYDSAVADLHNHCRWNVATLGTTFDMIKKCLHLKGKHIEDKKDLGFDVQIDVYSTPSGTDAQVNPEHGTRQGRSAVTQGRSKALKKLLDHTQNMSGDILHLNWIHYVDGGGQSEFLELLPALVSNVTVTVYVVDLSITPDDFCNDYFTINNQPQGDTEQKTRLTGKEIFERFIMTINSQAQTDKEKCKVMFVGTHYSRHSSHKELIMSNLKKWNKVIVEVWSKNDTAKKVEIIKTADMFNVHAIDANYREKGDNQHHGGDNQHHEEGTNQHHGQSDNQQLGDGNSQHHGQGDSQHHGEGDNQQLGKGDIQHGEDDDIQQPTAAEYMRKKLVECCIKESVAIAEFLIEEDLKTSPTAQENYGILSYSECLKFTCSYANETTLKKALRYFHGLNEFVVYFEPAGENSGDPKPDLVFTKPGILVQIISRLIKVANCYRRDPTTNRIPETFKIDGMISEDNLVVISNYPLRHGEKADENFNIAKYFRKDIFDAKKLLKVLQKLLIAASHTGSEYFIPCVLPPLNDKEYTSHFMENNNPLLITFKGCVPRGLFCGLVTYLLDECGWEIRPKNNQNYRTLIEFLTPKGRQYKVVLKDTFKAIYIYVDVCVAPKEHLTIRREIVDGIRTVCKKFYDSDDGCNMNSDASFHCPCKRGSVSHIANVITCENKTQPRLQCEETADIVHVVPEMEGCYYAWLHGHEKPWQSGILIVIYYL